MKVFLSSRAFLILSFLWLLSLPSYAYFQNATARVKTKYEFTDPRISEADTLLKKRQYQEALDAYQKAYDIYEAESFYEGMVYAKERMGRTYRGLGEDSLSKVTYQGAAALSREKLGPNHILESKAYLNNGIRAHRNRKFMLAAFLVDSASTTNDRSVFYDSTLIKQIIEYKYYTYFYSELNNDTLIKYLNERSRILDKEGWSLEQSIIVSTDYCAAYYMKGDFEKAVAYGLEATRLSKSSLELINPFYYRDAAYNLGKSLESKGEYELALKVTNELIHYSRANNINQVELLAYRNLKAIILNGKKEYLLASIELREIISGLEKTGNRGSSFYRDATMNLGVCYQLMGNYKGAEVLLLRALKEEKDAGALFDTPFISRYKYLAKLFSSTGDFRLSTYYYDSAIRNSVLTYDAGILEFPRNDRSEIDYEALLLLKDKQINLEKSYTNNRNDSLKLLSTVIEYAEATHELLMTNRGELQAAQGRLFMSENFKDLYESALNAVYLLINATGDDDYSFDAHKFLALTKSILFLEQSGELGQVQDSRLPISMKNEYYRIKTTIEKYEEQFYKLQDEITTNDSLRTINSELLKLGSELINFKDSLSNFLDLDKELSFSQNDLDRLERFLEYNDSTAVVEYFVGKRFTFILTSHSSGFYLERIELNDEFKAHFDSLLEALSSMPDISDYELRLDNYQSSAYFIYQKLLGSVLTRMEINPQRLLIIPDEFLSKIPFEALVSKEDSSARGFHELQYLIKNYTIGYFLSSKSIKLDPSAKVAGKSVFGIGFTGEVNADVRSGYGTLPGTENEIRFLEAELSGDFFLGEKATKELFMHRARNYDVLHLAIHGSADSTNRYESKLIFNGDDNILKTSDLYLADLKARLAILSACESGLGGINKGEGTFSIARGFALAGIPSVVMSLWKVNDRTTSEIMMSFHQNLKRDLSINEALASTKIEYLIKADQYTGHPYYWASFISLGEDITFNRSTQLNLMVFGVLSFILLLSSVLVIVKMKKRKEAN